MVKLTKVEEVMRIINDNRLTAERVKAIEAVYGKICGEFSMGSGGVGQKKYYKRLNETRIQIGYGHGKYNYAMCAVFDGEIN